MAVPSTPEPDVEADPDLSHTADGSRAGGQSPLLTAALRIEGEERLDPIVQRMDAIVDPLLGRPRMKSLLGGRWLGHAAHPLLTDLPIGFWTSATVLDVVGGRRSARSAQRLVGLGVLSAVPTAVTGWSDWLSLDRSLRRVGVVHAASNGAALTLYSLSWMARRKGHRGWGIALGMIGGAAASGAGHLGGHLTVGRGAGVEASEDARRAHGGTSRSGASG